MAMRAASAGFADAQQIWADRCSRSPQSGTGLQQNTLRFRNIHEVASVWIHDALTGLIEASTEMLRLGREAADQSLRPLEERGQRTARQGRQRASGLAIVLCRTHP